MLAEERGPGSTKFSLRTKAPLNVARDVAMPLGGGGHDCAAGVTVPLPLDEALGKRERERRGRVALERELELCRETDCHVGLTASSQ